MLKRTFAVLTTLLLAVGLTVGVTSAASAHTPVVEATCTTLDVTLSSYGANTTNYVTVTIDGNVVENHTQFANNFPKKQYTISPTTTSHTWKVEIDAQHNEHDKLGAAALTGTWIPCASTALTCDVATLYKGSALADGDQIDIKVTHNGGAVLSVTGKIETRQSSDPVSESGLVVRLKLESGNVTLPLTNAQKTSGIFAIEYSNGWTGVWVVQKVQYNSQYFNQSNDSTKYLHCDKDIPVTITTAPSATAPTCTVDGKLVVPATSHVTWTGGANGAGPGTYQLKATADAGYTLGSAQSTWTITVLPKGSGVNCEQSVKPDLTIADCNATTGAVTSAFITIPSTTPHLTYSIGATSYTAGQKVPLAPGTYTVTVTAAATWTNTGPGSYTIVVAALGCDKAVEPALTEAQCSTTTPPTVISAFITIPSTTPHLTYSIGATDYTAGQKVNLAAGTYVVDVTPDAGWKNTGPTSFTIVVGALGCEKAVEPALTAAVCTTATPPTVTSAFITIPSTTPHLTYSIGATTYAAGQKVNLAAGTYTVNVTTAAGWRNTGPTSFTIVVAPLGCEKSVQPALTAAECSVDSGALVSGFITIPSTTPHLTYSIGATTYAAGQKVNLAAGSYTVTVTPDAGWTNTGASSFPIVIADLGCESSEKPDLTVADCDVNGAVTTAYITIPTTTPHLAYSIGATTYTAGQQVPLTPGSYTVTVTPQSGWTNTGPTTFKISVDQFDCDKAVEPILTPAECTPLTGPFKAYVTIPTTTPHLIYSYGGADYPAGAKVELPSGPYTITVSAEPGWKNTGPASFSGTVDPVDCVDVAYVEPKITPQVCDTDLGGTKQGTLVFALDPDLAYYLEGALVTSTTPIPMNPGTYEIVVVPSAGHYLKNGIDTYYVTIDPAVGCDGVYTTPLDPYASPETCDPLSIDGEKVAGSVTVVHVAGVQFYIGTKADGSDRVAVGTPLSVGTVAYPYVSGDYYVFAESKDATITIKPGHTLWGPLTVGVPDPVCLPTRGLLEADAQAKGAVCDVFWSPRGSITVLPTPGVTYAFQGGAKITAPTTSVAPGTYTIVATADDGVSTLTASTWVVTVGTTLAVCDLTTLAFTGQNPTGFIVGALVLLQAGLALLAVRYIRRRRDPRHLA